MHILFKYPTRSRPTQFFKALDNLIENCESTDYTVLVTIDQDDKTMRDDSVINRLVNTQISGRLFVEVSDSRNKVAAINHAINDYKDYCSIICIHSDDMNIKVKGFDNIIREQFKDFSGLLHFPDGHANEKLCTYPVMDKAYYELDNFIYHPEFKSVYCDNLQHELAVKRGQYKFVNQHIFEHEHPVWGFGEYDELMKKNQDKKTYRQDYQTYLRLKSKYNLK